MIDAATADNKALTASFHFAYLASQVRKCSNAIGNWFNSSSV